MKKLICPQKENWIWVSTGVETESDCHRTWYGRNRWQDVNVEEFSYVVTICRTWLPEILQMYKQELRMNVAATEPDIGRKCWQDVNV
jgi:hypothetical protein